VIKMNENELNKEKNDKKEKIVDVKKNNKSNAGVILIVSILLSFVCGMLGAYLISQTVSLQQVVKNITTSELVENSISSSVEKVYGSTVVVSAYSNGKQISTVTGFIYKKAKGMAYIITNNHVIDGADKAQIEFNDSDKKIDAKIVGGDKYADIAVLTVDDNDEYKTVEIGDNEALKLGDTIFTVGTPMGSMYKGTVTKGILSGKDRMVEVNVSGSTADYYMKVIQIDAAVNPGNSGGPLCDVSGKVIGVISLKIVEDRVEGMGFAIPIEDALNYASIIEEGGQIVRPYIGISMVDLSEEYYLWQNRITIPEDVEEGIAVISVESGSPADKAGLKKGDIIVKLGGEDTGSLAEFRYELYKHEVGEKVELTIYRDNKKQKVSVTLGKRE
jgi:serine protease Do